MVKKNAAIPLAVAMEPTPPSKAANLSSSTEIVGFEILEYICPGCSKL